jgi:hypothetical protein
MMETAKRARAEREATWPQDGKELTELIEGAIDRGASSVEEIHRSIANLPLQVMESLGLFIRQVNREVGRLAADLLESRERGPSGTSRERAKRSR